MLIEIYFSDLIPECQAEILEAYGMTKPEEMNWDVVPLFELEVDQEESANE